MPDPTYPSGVRRAEPGERCDCGRQAQTVVTNPDRGDIGVCGQLPQPGPCVFCHDQEPHGNTDPCPRYRLRLEETT